MQLKLCSANNLFLVYEIMCKRETADSRCVTSGSAARDVLEIRKGSCRGNYALSERYVTSTGGTCREPGTDGMEDLEQAQM